MAVIIGLEEIARTMFVKISKVKNVMMRCATNFMEFTTHTRIHSTHQWNTAILIHSPPEQESDSRHIRKSYLNPKILKSITNNI